MHSLFNPRLCSLVPLNIVLVECNKHCFRLQNTRDLFFLEKKAPGRAAPHRISEWGCNNKLPGNRPMQPSGLHGSIFRESYFYMGGHDPQPCTSSANHAHLWGTGSKGTMVLWCKAHGPKFSRRWCVAPKAMEDGGPLCMKSKET